MSEEEPRQFHPDLPLAIVLTVTGVGFFFFGIEDPVSLFFGLSLSVGGYAALQTGRPGNNGCGCMLIFLGVVFLWAALFGTGSPSPQYAPHGGW